MTVGRQKTLARWVSWFFGLGLLVGVVMFAKHHSQEMAFAQLVLHARPAWLLVALLLQMGTYMTDARIWQRVLGRANISRPLRSYVGLGLAKLFMDQAIPSVVRLTLLYFWPLWPESVLRVPSIQKPGDVGCDCRYSL